MFRLETRPALLEQVYDTLKQAITTGDLAPATVLAQEALAVQLGVSRQPISHALLLLEKDGLVVEKGKKGRMVAPINRNKLRQLYQMRAVLDGLAAGLCAGQLTSDQLNQLRAELKRGFLAAKNRDIKEMVASDSSFHQTIYNYSCNPEIFRALGLGWAHMLRAMYIVLSSHPNPLQIWEEHEQIVEAIAGGSAEQARAAATGHAERSGQTTFENIGEEISRSA